MLEEKKTQVMQKSVIKEIKRRKKIDIVLH